MKITKEEDYAILLMTALAVKPRFSTSLQEIADQFDIPYYFLKKIARLLKDARLIAAKEGSAGGYRLALPAKDINLADIIEAIRGSEALSECANGQYCAKTHSPKAHKIMKKVSQEVRKLFSDISLSDMITS